MPTLTISCYAIFDCYCWETSSSLKGNGKVSLGEREGSVGTGRSRGRGASKDEKRMKNDVKIKLK